MLKSRNQCGKKTIYLILMVKSYKFAAGISLAMLVTVLCLVGCEPATDKSSQDQAGDSGRPNVVLIITDDQGYGDLGVHGNPIISTPNMDALAEESIRLEDYHVAPNCAPTRAGLLTGRWHNRTGVWHTVMGRSMLRQDEVTLADMLAANGYRTAMIGKWHLGDNYPYRPHDRGFEYAYYNGGGGVGQTPDFWNNAYFDGSYFRNGQAEPAEGYVTDVFFDEAIAFIDSVRGGDKPFFVYLATNAPHGPMHAPPQYADLYADEGLSVAVQHFLGMISNIDLSGRQRPQREHGFHLYDRQWDVERKQYLQRRHAWQEGQRVRGWPSRAVLFALAGRWPQRHAPCRSRYRPRRHRADPARPDPVDAAR
jgi:arylsulfatase A-like enzyme